MWHCNHFAQNIFMTLNIYLCFDMFISCWVSHSKTHLVVIEFTEVTGIFKLQFIMTVCLQQNQRKIVSAFIHFVIISFQKSNK